MNCDCYGNGTTCIACGCPCHRPLTTEARQTHVMQMFKEAARKFIDKVESGRTRSVETYADLKTALEKAKEWGL